MRKRMYFIGIMAQVGTYSTMVALLWWLTKLDALKILCISAAISVTLSLPILIQIERWISEK